MMGQWASLETNQVRATWRAVHLLTDYGYLGATRDYIIWIGGPDYGDRWLSESIAQMQRARVISHHDSSFTQEANKLLQVQIRKHEYFRSQRCPPSVEKILLSCVAAQHHPNTLFRQTICQFNPPFQRPLPTLLGPAWANNNDFLRARR